MADEPDLVEIPIDGTLDLHNFQPREAGGLVADYLERCRERGIEEVRIIHGKGTGQLRRTVHAVLGRNPLVQSFRTAGEDRGGWGATIVRLRKHAEEKGGGPMAQDTTDSNVYRKLQKKLDRLPVAFPATASGVEIRILKHLFTPEQAQVALSLSFIPEPATVIHKRLKKRYPAVAELEKILEQMATQGCIARSVTRNGVKIFSITMLAIGMFEFQVERLTKAFYEDFKQYIDEAFRDALLNPKFTQLRPVPTTGSITPDLAIMPYDDIRGVLNRHRGPFAVVECICKEGQDLLGEPCKATKDREICLIFGTAARNYLALGWGREIKLPEVFAILDKAEQDGLVVQPSNSQYPFCVCLCCGCCCEVLSNAKLLENPARLFYSNYYAVNDDALCSGCGLCVDRCQMEAIAMADDKSRIDPGRCIGCGLCITACPARAIRLKKKDPVAAPQKDTTQFYLTLMRARAGNARMFLMMIRRALGMAVP